MENHRFITLLKYASIIGMLFLTFPFLSYGYYPDTTHKGLTADIMRFFNVSYPNFKIDDPEKLNWIKKGSVDEDSPVQRSFNHFYDPIHNKGVLIYLSSKDWAQNTTAQAGNRSIFAGSILSYFGSSDDYSWERGIYEYTWGDKQRGLESLGHVLHLIEDASVPEHTRNDIHAGHQLPFQLTGISPYEDWTNGKFNEDTIKTSYLLQEKDSAPIICDTLESCFTSIAQYSNNNFFSKDTIFTKQYDQPIISEKSFEKLSDAHIYEFGYRTVDKEKYRLVLLGERLLGSTISNPSITDPD